MTFDRVFAGGRIAEDYATGAVWYDEGGYMMALFHLPRDRYEAIRDRVLRIDWQRGSDSDALWSHDPENNPTPPAYEDLVREAADLDHGRRSDPRKSRAALHPRRPPALL